MLSKNNPLRSEYLEHIEKQKISGLSIKQYCHENNLDINKLVYYRGYKLKSKKVHVEKSFSSVKIRPSIKEPPAKIDPIWLAKFITALGLVK